MSRLIRLAIAGVCLATGCLATLSSALFGWYLLRPHGCRTMSAENFAAMLTREAREAVDEFLVLRGRCPTGEDELVRTGRLNRPPRDRWGQALFYTCLETADDLVVSARSAGPDRIFWTADDIVAD
jgi:hypothetical protein